MYKDLWSPALRPFGYTLGVELLCQMVIRCLVSQELPNFPTEAAPSYVPTGGAHGSLWQGRIQIQAVWLRDLLTRARRRKHGRTDRNDHQGAS